MSRVYNEKFDTEAFKIEFTISYPDARGDMSEPRLETYTAGPYASMTDVNACIRRMESGRDNMSWRLRFHKGTVTHQIYRTTIQWEPVSGV